MLRHFENRSREPCCSNDGVCLNGKASREGCWTRFEFRCRATVCIPAARSRARLSPEARHVLSYDACGDRKVVQCLTSPSTRAFQSHAVPMEARSNLERTLACLITFSQGSCWVPVLPGPETGRFKATASEEIVEKPTCEVPARLHNWLRHFNMLAQQVCPCYSRCL